MDAANVSGFHFTEQVLTTLSNTMEALAREVKVHLDQLLHVSKFTPVIKKQKGVDVPGKQGHRLRYNKSLSVTLMDRVLLHFYSFHKYSLVRWLLVQH